MDEPPLSRLFVVCGKSAEAEMLQAAFEPYGTVQHVRVIRDKGVAYVKFDKASAAAVAMESLNGAVLNNGRGPKLKVLLAESPSSRSSPQTQRQLELELAFDPDNIPPRSRLFLVVPKTADGQGIKEEMSKYPDMEYCKIDLIASKGVVFCKYAKASSALKAMEEICDTGMLCQYKVKCMLAEPKSKRARLDSLMQGGFGPSIQTQLDFNMGGLHLSSPHTARSVHGDFRIAASPSTLSGYGGYTPYADAQLGGVPQMAQYSSYDGLNTVMQGLQGLTGLGVTGLAGLSVGSLTNVTGLTGKIEGANVTPQGNGSGALGALGNVHVPGNGQLPDSSTSVPGPNMGEYIALNSHLSPSSSPPTLSRQRLFVVVYKGVKEEELSRLFRRFAGMEYCDLKKDKKTGKSKGYCYVNYSTHEAAKAAVQNLNGIEFPPHSGHRMKVMFAEPLGVKTASQVHGVPPIGGPFSGATGTFDSARNMNGVCNSDGTVDGTVGQYDDTEGSVANGGDGHCENDSVNDMKVFTFLPRPLPDYAINHVFSKYGRVDYVKLKKDSRFGVVKFASADAARNAVQMLHGTDICGEALTVSNKPVIAASLPERAAGVAG